MSELLFSTGLEPATFCLADKYSIQMSYEGTHSWLPYYLQQTSPSQWWGGPIIPKENLKTKRNDSK